MGPGGQESVMPHPDPDAQQIAMAIRRNADDVHAKRISWDAFSERNGRLWRTAEAVPGLADRVHAVLRDTPR